MRTRFGLFSLLAINLLWIRHALGGLTPYVVALSLTQSALLALLLVELRIFLKRQSWR